MTKLLVLLSIIFLTNDVLATICNVSSTVMEASSMSTLPDGSTLVEFPHFKTNTDTYLPLSHSPGGISTIDFDGLCLLLGFQKSSSHKIGFKDFFGHLSGFLVNQKGEISLLTTKLNYRANYVEAVGCK